MGILGFIIYIIVAAVCAWIAEAVVPGRVPGGFLASIIVGIIGAWIGGSIFGHFGPDLGGIAVIPAIIGCIILVFLLGLFSSLFRGRPA